MRNPESVRRQGVQGRIWTPRRAIDKVRFLHLVNGHVLTCPTEQLRHLSDACTLIFKDLLEIAPSMKDVSTFLPPGLRC